jgi:hypothetical protein
MTQKYQEELSPQGELARDIKKDKERFPRNGHGKFKGWYRIFVGQEICKTHLDAFEECWKEYVECEKSKQN